MEDKNVPKNYTFDKNTYFSTPKDNPKDLIQVEIGDSKEPGITLPQAKICRWDNESNVSIRLKDFDNYSVVQEADKIIFGDETKEVHFYQIPDGEGANEIEVILKEKPKSNVIEFTLQDKDVEYFYQPFLKNINPDGSFWEEDDLGGRNECPANVGGSYAVYAKTPKTNWTGGKEYKCGKVGHIFRPKIIDSARTEVWGDLHIENGILSVTIPQEFLDKAVYPVRHAAGLEFGYHTLGTYDLSFQGVIYSYNSAPASTGVGSSISVALKGWGAGEKVKCNLYKYSDNSQVTNGQTEERTTGGSDGIFYNFNFTSAPSLVGGTAYQICMWTDSVTNLYYDSTGSDIYSYLVKAYGTWPTNTTGFTNSTGLKFSIYATYTTGAAGPAKLKTWNGLATAKIKTINGLAIAKVKTINGLV
jgi:hypothetical protein